MRTLHWVLMILIVVVTTAGLSLNYDPEPKPLKLPSNFPPPVYDLASNPITKEGFELGRKLFYDPILSRDGTISCGSCHIQASAFTHHSHDVSHGIDDRLGFRNSPPVMNLAWSRFFFWDGGVFHLDLQPIGPIENPDEMGDQLKNVISKLQRNKKYPALFEKAFGPGEINSQKFLKALSQFMLSCISANAKYDSVVRGEGPQFTLEEEKGKELFKEKCSSCHSTDLFSDQSFHNVGLAPNYFNDSGRYRISLDTTDWYRFKTPSLRNVMFTAPYMHDGRFETLEQVFDHYDHDVKDMPSLDPILRKNGRLGIALSADERTLLIAFLKTLTDERFIRDPLFSEQ